MRLISRRQTAADAAQTAESAKPWAALARGWRSLPQRDRRLALLGTAVLLLFAVWALAVQPALSTLRAAPTELDRLEAQLQTMQRLATEAAELRATPAVGPEQAAEALKAATERLGERGRLSLQGDRAVLTLNGAGTEALRNWLAEARSAARARPIEVNLLRAGSGYSGTLVVALGNAS
jgi:general secretion pathway protein M